MTSTKALIAALFVAGGALASAFASAAILRRSEAQVSRQQPAKEVWFETPTSASPEILHRGRALFLNSCAHCHAADARGDEGPDLHGVQVSDRYIAKIITRGIPHEMPAFGKKYDAADINTLITYLRSLE